MTTKMVDSAKLLRQNSLEERIFKYQNNAMGFAVYHMEKGKGGSGGIGRHIDRIESKYGYSTYQHADSYMRELNQEFILNKHCEKHLPKAIGDRIKEGYTGVKEIRKDAVKFQTHVLTGSHEEMKHIFASKETSDNWIKENIDWMCEKYGKENIVRFTLHMDEKTPHIHAITVPITSDGRLSAKSYADGKKALRELQTSYGERMGNFGLQRGLERIGIKHESAQEYYARSQRVNEYMNRPEIKPIEPKTSFMKTNIDEIYKQNQNLSELVASFTETLDKQERKLEELSNISMGAIARSRVLIRDKDSIIENKVNLLTDNYKREIEEKNKTLSEQRKVLDNPILLMKRARDIEEQRQQVEKANRRELLEKLECEILSEATFKLERGEKVDICDIDDWIREYAPKEKLGVFNPWEALDIITDDKRSQFESSLYEKVDFIKESLQNEMSLPLLEEEEIPKKRKRGRGVGR